MSKNAPKFHQESIIIPGCRTRGGYAWEGDSRRAEALAKALGLGRFGHLEIMENEPGARKFCARAIDDLAKGHPQWANALYKAYQRGRQVSLILKGVQAPDAAFGEDAFNAAFAQHVERADYLENRK